MLSRWNNTDSGNFVFGLMKALPLVTAFTLAMLVIFSNVPIEFYLLPYWVSDILVAGYAVLLIIVTFINKYLFTLHRIGGALAVFIFTGRSLGFFDLVVANDRFDLIGAVSERFIIIIALVYFHATAANRVNIKKRELI